MAEGECSVDVDGVEVPGPYGTYSPKSIFGELGVLYSSTGAFTTSSTITAKTDSAVLFRASGAAVSNALNTMPVDDINDGPNKDGVEMRAIDRAIDQLSWTKSLYGGEITRQCQPIRFGSGANGMGQYWSKIYCQP